MSDTPIDQTDHCVTGIGRHAPGFHHFVGVAHLPPPAQKPPGAAHKPESGWGGGAGGVILSRIATYLAIDSGICSSAFRSSTHDSEPGWLGLTHETLRFTTPCWPLGAVPTRRITCLTDRSLVVPNPRAGAGHARSRHRHVRHTRWSRPRRVLHRPAGLLLRRGRLGGRDPRPRVESNCRRARLPPKPGRVLTCEPVRTLLPRRAADRLNNYSINRGEVLTDCVL
ncbi:MAG: hypothetical protein JWO38_4460 [Gemmataceae bacterium]|nr:hypothetical protein [Gemmataceae bacterium]